jgi:hypothetical protein
MKILVCGGRYYNNANFMNATLNGFGHISEIIEGGASGADSLANIYADLHGIPVNQFKADWKKHGRAAGPIRNKQMLEESHPDLVVAFEGGKGTANMINQARSLGVTVFNAAMLERIVYK